MKIRTLFLATAVLATASSYAFAQTPTERTGSKTDNGTQMQNDSKMAPKAKRMKSTTSGSGMGSGMGAAKPGAARATGAKANGPMMNKNVSPSSMQSGEKQQK